MYRYKLLYRNFSYFYLDFLSLNYFPNYYLKLDKLFVHAINNQKVFMEIIIFLALLLVIIKNCFYKQFRQVFKGLK